MLKKMYPLWWTLGLLMSGCGDEQASDSPLLVAEEASEPLFIETQFLSDAYDIPSKEELIEDARYMREINEGKGNTQLSINHSDDLQHRYALHHLARAGLTPDSAPMLHRALQRLRRESLARVALGLEPTAVMGNTYNHFHAFDTTNPTSPIGYGVVSYSAETSKLVVDAAIYEVLNGEWFERGYKQTSVPGKTASIGTSLYPGEVLQGGTVVGESYAVQTSPSGAINESYSYDESDGFESMARIEGGTTGDSLTVVHPADRTNDSDVVTKICTNRSSVTDCDYYADVANQKWYVYGTPYPAAIQSYHVYVPLQGSAIFNSLSTITDIDKDCDNLSDSSAQDTVRTSECVHLMLQNIGSCEPNPTLSLDKIWSSDPNVQNKIVFNTISTQWLDSTAGDPIDMDTGTGCTTNNVSDATLWVESEVRGTDTRGNTNRSKMAGRCLGTTNSGTSGACLSNGAANGSLQVVKSCIAEGSLVRLTSGKEVPIEQVRPGDRVLSDESGRSLTVMDRTIGTEDVPMIRIQDSEGHSLLVTELHAIPTLNRGIVAASALREDDLLMTEHGMATITGLRQEVFDGGVFNLTLGAAHELPRLRREDTTMLVNGILVGDQRMQNWLGDRLIAEAALAEPIAGEW